MKHVLSIIVPIYNVEKYLLKCLSKLESQKLNGIQVVLINDGSTDESGKICKDFIKQSNLHNEYLYLEKENGGLSDARNFGIEYADGEYICFLDSDDFVDDNTYFILLNEISTKQLDYVDCAFYLTFEKKEYVKSNSNLDIYQLAAYGHVMAWNKIYKKSIIINNHLKFPIGLYYEDVLFFYSYLNVIDENKIGHVNIPLIHYVQRTNSISKISTKKVEDILKIYNLVLHLDSKFSNEIEYRCVKNLNGSFLKIALKISGKDDKMKVLANYKCFIENNFPNWRKNKYFRKKNLTNLIIKNFTSKFLLKG